MALWRHGSPSWRMLFGSSEKGRNGSSLHFPTPKSSEITKLSKFYSASKAIFSQDLMDKSAFVNKILVYS